MAALSRDRALRLVVLVLLASTALYGCSLVLDVEGEQCTNDQECVGLFGHDYVCTGQHVCVSNQASGDGDGDASLPGDGGDQLPPQWRWIEEPPRVVLPNAGRVLMLSLAVTDFVDLTVPAGLVGRACGPTDVMCTHPLIEGVMPDDDGYLNFEVAHGWTGYFELNAPGYLPSIVSSNEPYTVDGMPEGTTLLTEEALRQIAEGGNEDIEPMTGVVLLAVYDCDGNPAPGVTFVQELSEDDETEPEHPFYFEGTLPDRDRDTTAISRGLTRTMNPLAVGGFSRVKKGYATMIGVLAETGQEIGRAEVQVRPLTMTISELHAGY